MTPKPYYMHPEHNARTIVTWTAAVGLVLAWAWFAWWAWHQHDTRMKSMERILDRHRVAISESVESLFRMSELMLMASDRWIREHPEKVPDTDLAFQSLIESLQMVSGRYMSFRLADADGTLRAVPADKGNIANIADREYFKVAMKTPPGTLSIGTPLISRVSNLAGFSFVLRLTQPSQNLALAIVSMNLPLFEELFAKAIPSEGGSVIMVRRDGILLVRVPTGQVEIGKDISRSMLFTHGLSRAPEGIQFADGSQTDGVPRLGAFGTLKRYPVVVALAVDQKSIFEETQGLLYRVGALMALGSLLFGFLLRKVLHLIDDVEAQRMNLTASHTQLQEEVTHRRQVEEQLKASQVELQQLATTDPLTALYNRRHFDHCAHKEFRRSRRFLLPFAVLMLDIDHFKQVNDTYGHASGDTVLSLLGQVLLRQCRDSDVACRYGGEEFAILLPGTSLAGALEMGERLRESVEKNQVPLANGQTIQVTISVGVAQLEDGDEAFAQPLSRADAALYQAKAAGRNRVVAHQRTIP